MLALDTPIATSEGWSCMGDLHPGDRIFDDRGESCTVLAAHPVEASAVSYRVRFDDGAEIRACADHLWLTFDARELAQLTRRSSSFRARRRASRPSRVKGTKSAKFTAALRLRNSKNPPPTKRPPQGTLRTTAAIARTLITPRGRRNHAIPVAKPLHLPHRRLPLDPYLLGAWLGDGTTKNGAITTGDQEIREAFVVGGFEPGFVTEKQGAQCATYGFRGLRTALGQAGVFGQKHLPDQYLWASAAQRLALLQGLMDTDGTVDKRDGSCDFTTTSERLARGVYQLIAGLGWKVSLQTHRAKWYGRDCGAAYRLIWKPSQYVFRLDRKCRWQQLARRRTTRLRYVAHCDRIESQPMRCITVDSPSGLYLAGYDLVATHNTDCLVNLATRHTDKPGYRALLLRRTFPRLQEIMDRCWRYYPTIGGVYRATEKRWYFPGGDASRAHKPWIQLGHMQHEDDRHQYQGAEYHFCGFDEVSQFTGTQYLYMLSRVRSTDARLRPKVRATTNPGGIGHLFFKQRFVDVASASRSYIDPATGLSRAFIPAKIYDNPTLIETDPDYLRRLQALPLIERKRLLDGDWEVFAGQVFGALSDAVHGCDPFDIPPEWERVCVLDWGYARPFSVGWYAIDYDGLPYRYREWYGCKPGEDNVGLRLTAEQVAQGIIERESGEHVRTRIADPSIFSNLPKGRRGREARGPNIGEDLLAAKLFFLKADNDRLQGLQQVHKRFALREEVDLETGEIRSEEPQIQVFRDQPHFWRTLPALQADPSHPEDVDTEQEDHIYDELRYFAMWRPVRPKPTLSHQPSSFQAERARLIKAKRLAARHGISVAAAYGRRK